MKTKSLRTIIAAVAITVVAGVFAGCGSNSGTSNSGNNSGVSGSITLAGSTALQPLAQEAGKQFAVKNPNATINVQGGGSGTGIKLVSDGTADIGDSDITTAVAKLDPTKAKALVDHRVAVIGFAVVTNSSVKVDNLTKDQIQKIFTGQITNWSQVGGDNMTINVINRPKSSGTRATFINTIMGGTSEKEGLGTTQDSSGSVQRSIESTKGSISYLALSYLSPEVRKSVKVLNIEGVAATTENITTGKYPFWSYEHMYTKGEAKGLAKSFLDYMVSDANKASVQKLGYIPMGDMKVK
jgi:phosphate transport system substrate-binding protein